MANGSTVHASIRKQHSPFPLAVRLHFETLVSGRTCFTNWRCFSLWQVYISMLCAVNDTLVLPRLFLRSFICCAVIESSDGEPKKRECPYRAWSGPKKKRWVSLLFNARQHSLVFQPSACTHEPSHAIRKLRTIGHIQYCLVWPVVFRVGTDPCKPRSTVTAVSSCNDNYYCARKNVYTNWVVMAEAHHPIQLNIPGTVAQRLAREVILGDEAVLKWGQISTLPCHKMGYGTSSVPYSDSTPVTGTIPMSLKTWKKCRMAIEQACGRLRRKKQ